MTSKAESHRASVWFRFSWELLRPVYIAMFKGVSSSQYQVKKSRNSHSLWQNESAMPKHSGKEITSLKPT
jgi:hypothetical protein